jgi:hypothetical protein
MPPNPRTGKYLAAQPRHGRAGCASAYRRSGRPPRVAHPIRVQAVRGDGPRAAGGGTGRRYRATAPRARPHRLRVGAAPKWPQADVAPRGRPPPRAHPHPRAGGRGDGPRAAGGGTEPPVSSARSALWHPTPGTRKYRPPHLCHGRAGCAAASRRSGGSPTFLVHAHSTNGAPLTGRPRATHGCGALRTPRVAHPGRAAGCQRARWAQPEPRISGMRRRSPRATARWARRHTRRVGVTGAVGRATAPG